MRRGGRAGQLRAPDLRCPAAHAAAVVDHAGRCARRLDRDSLQGRRPGSRGPVDATGRRDAQRARADRPRLRRRSRPSARAADRWRRGHSADDLPGRVARARGALRDWQPLVLMGSEIPFPFTARPSTLLVPGMPDGRSPAMPLLEDWNVPSRLASLAGFPGLLPGLCDGARRAVARLARAGGARAGGDLCLRSDADAAGDCASSRGASACLARCRSRSSWPARSAAALAARCRS